MSVGEGPDHGKGTDRPPVTIEGVVERIVYENPENGFFVARLREDKTAHLTTFVGNLMAISPGETVRLTGTWQVDPRFGEQLRVSAYETLQPATIAGIEKYLGSGLIKGIGKKYAKRLVDRFGVQTLRIIDEEPKRLREVEGIGAKLAKKIREAWEEQRAIQSIMMFLQGHGISVSQAVRIYKRYGDGAVAVLRQDPYTLAGEVAGIAFRTADEIARKLDIPPDARCRLEAGLKYTLGQGVAQGHVYLTEKTLLEETSKLLDVPEESLPIALDAVLMQGVAVRENDAVYLEALYDAECACDRYLKRLLSTPAEPVTEKIDAAVAWVQKANKITLSPEQCDALRRACTDKVMVITGGPGTGKTTLVNSLLAILQYKGLSVALAAPTGRAAKRMEEATHHEARTLHRLLEFSPRINGFERNETNPLTHDVIIIDEASMIDVALMHRTLAAIAPHTRLVLVGDIDQLPSVGPGTVLMDIIASAVVPTVRLATVFRQAEQSGIVRNAHKINQGQLPDFNETDFFFVERKDPARALETVVELITERIPKKFGLDPLRDVQVLAPMRRGEAGVARLNEVLREHLNPHGELVGRSAIKVGDKVMQTRNNYELDVYNGDVGVVQRVDTELGEVEIGLEDRTVLYALDDLDQLTHAYATTVHKAQGSEYKAIVMPLLPQHHLLLQRNLLYTAITRAKELVVIVGDLRALRTAVGNSRISRRNTRLAERLRNAVKG